MNSYNVILTGIPRAGTTLSCVLLNKLPNTIALVEPMLTSELGSDGDVPASVESFFDQSRESLLSRREARSYQLTHDYLVPSLRAWLTRKQRESRRGRAELRLAERAGEPGRRAEK